MEYTTDFDEASGICTIRITGQHKRPQDSLTIQKFTRDFSEERNCKMFLIDMTQAEFIGGTMDIFKTGTFPNDQNHRQVTHKYALLYSEILDDHKFLENVSVNRGYQVRMFDNVDKALEWLKL